MLLIIYKLLLFVTQDIIISETDKAVLISHLPDVLKGICYQHHYFCW